MAKLPVHPKNPDRICWGCDKFCPAESLACGNGTIRTQHPAELFGDDWLDWAEQRDANADSRRRELANEQLNLTQKG